MPLTFRGALVAIGAMLACSLGAAAARADVLACCNDSTGGCVLADVIVCPAGSSAFFGTTCSPNPCRQVACCAGYVCSLSVDGVCPNGGLSQGAFSVCTPLSCPFAMRYDQFSPISLTGRGNVRGVRDLMDGNPPIEIYANGFGSLTPFVSFGPGLGGPTLDGREGGMGQTGSGCGSPESASYFGSAFVNSSFDASAGVLTLTGNATTGGCLPATAFNERGSGGASVEIEVKFTVTSPIVADFGGTGKVEFNGSTLWDNTAVNLAPVVHAGVLQPGDYTVKTQTNSSILLLPNQPRTTGGSGAAFTLHVGLPVSCCNAATGACEMSVNNACTNGGVPGQYGTSCTPNPCPQVACCTGGYCELSENGVCANGGIPQGAGSTCNPQPCPQFACCEYPGYCFISTNGLCGRASAYTGSPTCTPNPCPQTTCCTSTGACALTVNGLCTNGGTLGAFAVPCSPNPCAQPKACCDQFTGVCVVVPPLTPCAAGSVEVPGPPGVPAVCAPSPCPFPNAITAGACEACTWINGPFDGVNGQLSHLGGGYPRGGKAADDFYLLEDFMHDVRQFSATLLTNTQVGLVKPKAEIWTDCNGCPGTLLYTFDNPLVIETGTDIGPAFDGRPLRVVHATFDVTRENILANKNIVLKGGRYWLSIYGQTVANDPSDVTYWGTTSATVKGKAAYKIDGNQGNPYNVFTFPSGCSPTAWHSVVGDCCVGCKDLNFSFCTSLCKILVDNGAARIQTGAVANGSTSQFAGGTFFETRSADDFNVPPCQDYRICYVEACILTNCPTFEGVFELYANNCNKPSYALNGQPLLNTQYTATKIIPLGPTYNSTIDGVAVQAYKLEFHDLNLTLTGGSQYWISAGVRYAFNSSFRAYFCYNAFCNNACNIKWNSGRVLTFQTLDAEAAAHGCTSPAPVTGCNGWAKVNNDFSFLIAADGTTSPGPINSVPSCGPDLNGDGDLTVQDVFDYLNMFFNGCP